MKLKKLIVAVSGALLVAGMFGCGDVEWFPENNSTTGGNSPNAFTFTTPAEVTQAVASGSGVVSQSNTVTVTGTQTTGWTVTVTDVTPGADSKVNIAGAGFNGTTGTILPNQTLQVEHTPSKTVGGQVTTQIKVGDYTTTFTTNTIANP
ncbi:hypothetical protein LPW11_15080 [Geomonas sp. RF6]|uniref:hypothetical protein n=1 Tax=Geomonas sp. RF6 TaxID=2897342 RepID=UPI001E504B3D|nr:hypothetical protein [Geomonas sp. RF6]UFS69216.1 hypothetical protein LPW11_15080 [Geomonas sp. RF6]